MPIGWLSRKLNDYAKIPYKYVIWTGKHRKVYKKAYFKINEPITNSLGAYIESGEPTYSDRHIEVYMYDINNALQLRLANEQKEKEERIKKINAIPSFYRQTLERLKDISMVLGNKINYPTNIKLDEKENMKLMIKEIAPQEYRAVKELRSLEKVLKTDKPTNPMLENKNTILLLAGAAIAVYIVAHYILGAI